MTDNYRPDLYDHIELAWPAGEPQPPLPTWLTADWMPCMDCRANVFMQWLPSQIHPPRDWFIRVAHDDTCPRLARIERDG